MFSNTSIFVSELRVILRRYLGKKKVWQLLSFLLSTNMRNVELMLTVSLQNYSPPNITGQFL